MDKVLFFLYREEVKNHVVFICFSFLLSDLSDKIWFLFQPSWKIGCYLSIDGSGNEKWKKRKHTKWFKQGQIGRKNKKSSASGLAQVGLCGILFGNYNYNCLGAFGRRISNPWISQSSPFTSVELVWMIWLADAELVMTSIIECHDLHNML